MASTYREENTLARVSRIPDLLVNQIAAGEVVERPASALKELIENSLDAGSRRITVHLKEGGMTEITVIDDGRGIHPEDLALSLERHATSKLATSEDLESIGTYGFRGEALASIASVAEVDVKSRPAAFPNALGLSVHYGLSQGEPRPMGAATGTTVSVRGLFAQLPARKKFLRSAGTEFSHCARVVKELAVGNPQAEFALHHQGRLVNSYVGNTRESRVAECFSWDWKPLRVREQADDLALDAFLLPGDVTQDRGELLLFVNGRPVRNRGLLSAIRQAYLGSLGPHHDPSGVVYLDIRKDWVDVNVHPQKTEVRCLKQETLYGWLISAIRKAIAQQPTIRAFQVSEPPAQLTTASVTAPPLPRWEPPPPRPVTYTQPDFNTVAPTFSAPTATYTAAPERRWKYLGQIRAAYLLCEDAEGLLLIDQHALHEKFRYEELRRKHGEGKMGSQRLLIPKILRLEPELAGVLEETAEKLLSLGFELEAFGDGDWALKAIPELVEEARAEKMVLETLRAVASQMETDTEVTQRLLTPVLATIACHSVVRAGQTLSDFEAESLLENIDALELGWTCPHGRPVVFRLGYKEIEKHFERI